MKLKLPKLPGVVRNVAVAAMFIAMVTLLMLWLAGRFSPKIAAAGSTENEPPAIPEGAAVVEAHIVRLPVTESAVGTIQAVHETTIASRILARVVEINLRAGQPVSEGDVLLRLDDTDLRARLQQAKAAADAATAEHDQAIIDEKRLASLIQSKAVSAKRVRQGGDDAEDDGSQPDARRGGDRRGAGRLGVRDDCLADGRNRR